jgi:hypothetical protein
MRSNLNACVRYLRWVTIIILGIFLVPHVAFLPLPIRIPGYEAQASEGDASPSGLDEPEVDDINADTRSAETMTATVTIGESEDETKVSAPLPETSVFNNIALQI